MDRGGGGGSRCGTGDLGVVVGGLHLEDVRDDAVDGHVADQAGEE